MTFRLCYTYTRMTRGESYSIESLTNASYTPVRIIPMSI